MYSTAVVQRRSGRTKKNEEWSSPLYQYQIGLKNRSAALTRQLYAFFNAVARGRAHGFRFRDWNPGEAVCDNDILGTGDGAETVFQLNKYYASGSSGFARIVTKPVPGSTTCTIDGTTTTAFTVDTTTGLITFTSPPGNGLIVRASCVFDVPVEFASDSLDIESTESDDAFSWQNIKLVETRNI